MTRDEFVVFLKTLKEDFDDNYESWENTTLADFLEAMVRYTEDIQVFYDHTNSGINADIPSWENFKNIMLGASIYE